MSGTTRRDGGRRQTQEERSAATIAKLLDATIECLIETGYAQTTSRAVAERAGISRGGASHHFAKRVDLIVAAVERIARLRAEGVLEELKAVPSGAGRVRAVLDALWRDYSSPRFSVTLSLWVAAQQDQELYERLIPVEREASRFLMAGFEELMGDRADFPELAERYRVATSAIRGLALMESFEPRSGNRRSRSWHDQRRVLEELLSAA